MTDIEHEGPESDHVGVELSPRARSGIALAAVLLSLAVGLLAGLGFYTFHFAQGLSYLSNDPKACMNCHIMREHYDSWSKSAHHNWAVCNDCHSPHDPLGKMINKADNGWNHSVKFTLQTYTDPIQIREVNRDRLRHNCIACHSGFISATLNDAHVAAGADPHVATNREELDCLRCHRDVGHGARR
ncbi:MAG: cytochrome c nitrite reductase small subunit [bacterium]|nr:cytochrome c nitrite reductase small subunit [bacterium]